MKNDGNTYSFGGMIIATILGIISFILIIIFKNIFLKIGISFQDAIATTIPFLIFCLFFIFICFECWIGFIFNCIIPPKKETLYLIKKDQDNFATFINKKGKQYFQKNCKLRENNYYLVLKTKDCIKKILEESVDTFIIPKEKESYWKNFYCVIGNFKNIKLLPIIYLILVIGVVNIISNDYIVKFIGIILTIISILIILYDLKYKIKHK